MNKLITLLCLGCLISFPIFGQDDYITPIAGSTGATGPQGPAGPTGPVGSGTGTTPTNDDGSLLILTNFVSAGGVTALVEQVSGVLSNPRGYVITGTFFFVASSNFIPMSGASLLVKNALAAAGGTVTMFSGGGTNGQQGGTITIFGARSSGNSGSMLFQVGSSTNGIVGASLMLSGIPANTLSPGTFLLKGQNASITGVPGGSGSISSGADNLGGLGSYVQVIGADGTGLGGYIAIQSGGTSNAPGVTVLIDDGDALGNAGSADFKGLNRFSVTFTNGTANGGVSTGAFTITGATIATLNGVPFLNQTNVTSTGSGSISVSAGGIVVNFGSGGGGTATISPWTNEFIVISASRQGAGVIGQTIIMTNTADMVANPTTTEVSLPSPVQITAANGVHFAVVNVTTNYIPLVTGSGGACSNQFVNGTNTLAAIAVPSFSAGCPQNVWVYPNSRTDFVSNDGTNWYGNVSLNQDASDASTNWAGVTGSTLQTNPFAGFVTYNCILFDTTLLSISANAVNSTSVKTNWGASVPALASVITPTNSVSIWAEKGQITKIVPLGGGTITVISTTAIKGR